MDKPGEMTPEEHFRRNMRRIREQLGISQHDLALAVSERTGQDFRQQTVQKLESGTRALKIDEAMAIAEALRVPITDLLAASGPDEFVRTVQAFEAARQRMLEDADEFVKHGHAIRARMTDRQNPLPPEDYRLAEVILERFVPLEESARAIALEGYDGPEEDY